MTTYNNIFFRRLSIVSFVPGMMLLAFLLFSVLDCCADSVEDFFNQGEQAYQQGNYPKAIDFYEGAIELDPNFAPAYNGLGLVHKDINTDLSEVAWLFKVATEIDPNYAQAYDNLGKAYYGLGEMDNAEEACLKALSLVPNLVSAQLSLGWIYLLGKSDPNEAIYYFNEILKSHQIPYANFGLGMAYFMNGDRSKVLEIITALRAADKEDLAKQLESMVRQQYYVQAEKNAALVNAQKAKEQPSDIALAEKEPGQLIKAMPGEEPAEAESQPHSLSNTIMKVRMRGKMVGGTDQGTKSAAKHSPIEKIRNIRENATVINNAQSQVSGIDKVKEMQRLQRLRSRGLPVPSSTTSSSTGY